MSFDDDEPALPSNDDCEDAIKQFAEITETDEAFAHFMLQEYKFDLDRALTRYYENATDLYTKFKDNSSVSANVKIKASNHDNEIPGELTLLTWNVDGIDPICLGTRFTAVLYTIAKANPEVIFLQEMVHDLMARLKNLLENMYNIFVSDENDPYFCVTLVSKNISILRQEVSKFANSQMYRSFTCVECVWQKLKLNLINTHLESCKENQGVRQAQLVECFKKMNAYIARDSPDNEGLTIFAGDLNVRDPEVPKLERSIKDAWEAAGQPKNYKFTWDTLLNDNRKLKFVARCRFDRIYFSGPYKQIDLSFQGIDRIRGVNCFPSDHFSLVCKFRSPTCS